MDLRGYDFIYRDADVAVWVIDISKNEHMSPVIWNYLNQDEKKRAVCNSKFLLQRGICKLLLSDYLGITPNLINVKKDNMGKPFIENGHFKINYSHSGKYFMLGVSKLYKVGVDVQIPKKMKYDYPTMVFNKEEQDIYMLLSGQEEKADFFWRKWTLKEAYSKALGLGMTINFCEISAYRDESVENAHLKEEKVKQKTIVKTAKMGNFYFSYVLLAE